MNAPLREQLLAYCSCSPEDEPIIMYGLRQLLGDEPGELLDFWGVNPADADRALPVGQLVGTLDDRGVLAAEPEDANKVTI